MTTNPNHMPADQAAWIRKNIWTRRMRAGYATYPEHYQQCACTRQHGSVKCSNSGWAMVETQLCGPDGVTPIINLVDDETVPLWLGDRTCRSGCHVPEGQHTEDCRAPGRTPKPAPLPPLDDDTAAWIRLNAWDDAHRKAHENPYAQEVAKECPCLLEQTGACRTGKHGKCSHSEPGFVPGTQAESTITYKGRGLTFAEDYQHIPLRSGDQPYRGSRRVAFVWYADRACKWKCSCECHATVPAAPEPAPTPARRPEPVAPFTDELAEQIRALVWTPAMKIGYRSAPKAAHLCACQYGRSGYCETGKHGGCTHGAADFEKTPVPETYICRSNGTVTSHAEPYQHGTRSITGKRQVRTAFVWLADRKCAWKCSCDCHTAPPVPDPTPSLFPDLVRSPRPAPKPKPKPQAAEQLDLFGALA